MLDQPWFYWTAFNVFIIAMLAMDLLLHRDGKVMSIKSALAWSGFWVGLAVAFAGAIYYLFENKIAGFGAVSAAYPQGLTGSEATLQYLAAYLIEESLSVDNLFVFLLIFAYFGIKPEHQRRVLFWGILGAIVCRAVFILVGMELVHRFHFIIYIFGAFLIYTGVKMALKSEEEEIAPEQNIVLKLTRKVLPVSDKFDGSKFFTRENGKLVATPMFIVLLVVESTDVMFATDSIPAVIAITHDRFIAYTSNIFAILGLRAMYFALSGMMEKFHALHYGLAGILAFVGAKMLLTFVNVHVPISVTLGIVATVLIASVAVSLIWPKAKTSESTT